MSEADLDKRVMKTLKDLGLDATKDLKVGSAINKFISGGQRKRLNIALELIREPAVLFLDEPTSGLSSADTEKVINLLKEQTQKGKLIIVNIHQPSSDVYKLFDRLWLLDKGGYPVFDGNPIDAITYFKTAADYADADTSACPTCGNVNPEIVLNIIDEKALNNNGEISDERKMSPQEWHELYLKNRPELPEPKVSEVPPSDQKKPNAFLCTAGRLLRDGQQEPGELFLHGSHRRHLHWYERKCRGDYQGSCVAETREFPEPVLRQLYPVEDRLYGRCLTVTDLVVYPDR